MSDLAATFNPVSFAEGRFRRAYMGTWTMPLSKRGQRCVVKKSKEKCTWQQKDWDTTKAVQEEAQNFADKFNDFLVRTNYPIRFTEVNVLQVSSVPNIKDAPKLNEYVITEDYIEGEFKKWCNNYGYVSEEAKTTAISMPAFMHWSWYHTKGQMMIADLQGAKLNNSYLLTDPVILSDDDQFGCTDMGVEGMMMFFRSHKCNKFCSSLPAPTIRDFIGILPPLTLSQCSLAMPSVTNCTAFQKELKLTRPVKNDVLRTFRNVAARI